MRLRMARPYQPFRTRDRAVAARRYAGAAQAQADAVAEQCRAADIINRTRAFRSGWSHAAVLVAPVRPAILRSWERSISSAHRLFQRSESVFSCARRCATGFGGAHGMGASCGAVRQMLAEALWFGHRLRLGFGWLGRRSPLLAMAPGNLPRLDATRMDPRCSCSAWARDCGRAAVRLAPALRAARPDVRRCCAPAAGPAA